jgi:DNA-binding transcriptional MocR family regulator
LACSTQANRRDWLRLMTVPAARLASLLGGLSGERPPLYAALAARLRLLVADGRLPVGTRLPPERELALVLHVSRATVTNAYGRLREEGWAAARQGAGTWTRLPAGADPGPWVPAPAEPGLIDLAHAAPPAPPEVTASLTAALQDLPRLLPGHGYSPHGLPELRVRIAERFAARGLPTAPEQVLVTGGALHAVSLALAALGSPGDRILVEHPTYPNSLDAAAGLGLVLVPVAVSARRPEAVAGDLHRAARQAGPRLAYLMPDFSNPTGLLLDDAQRQRLAVGLEQCDVLTIVDETLAELGLDQPAPAPLASFVRPGLSVTVGSMSKTFWGGLRVGWLRAEPDVVAQCARVLARTQVALPVLDQLAACHLLDRAHDVLVPRRAALRVQRDALLRALSEQLPAWEVPVPTGGLVLWCRLPRGSSSALAAAAHEHGLRLAAGPRFGTGSAFDDHLRLPYTAAPDVLAEGAVRLRALVEAVLPGRRSETESDRLVV